MRTRGLRLLTSSSLVNVQPPMRNGTMNFVTKLRFIALIQIE